MIFTREQWASVKKRWNDSGHQWDPNDIIKAAAVHDALELGIHQTWIDYWDRDGLGWGSCAYVLAAPKKYASSGFGMPRKMP